MRIVKEPLESVLGETRCALVVEVESASHTSDDPYHRTLDVTARPIETIFGEWATRGTFTCRYSEGVPHRRGDRSVSARITGSGMEWGAKRGDRVVLLLLDSPVGGEACTLLRIEPVSQASFVKAEAVWRPIVERTPGEVAKQRYREAVARLEEQIAKEPNYSTPYMTLGELHFQAGEHVEAFTAWDRAAELDTSLMPGNKAFFMNLCMYEVLLKDAPHLVTHYDHVFLRFVRCYAASFLGYDNFPKALHDDLVRWTEGRGSDREAIAALHEIVERHPDGLSSLALVEALVRAGDIDQAIERLGIASRILGRSRRAVPQDVARRILLVMLLRVLRARFGAPPAELVARVIAAPLEQLDRWITGLPLARGLDDFT